MDLFLLGHLQSRIFVLDPELEQYLEIPCRTLSRPSITLWEHKEALKRLRAQGQEINETLIFRAVDDMRSITKEAVVKSRAARRKHQRLQDINKESTEIKGDDVTGYSYEKPAAEVLPFEDIEIW